LGPERAVTFEDTTAIGGNPTGAREAGVPSTRIRMGNFVMAAMLAGFAGVIEGIRIGSFDPGAGVVGQRVFVSVAAAVIGGTLLTGGAGTVIGAFLGALVLAILRDGFVLAGVSAFTFDIVLGAAIIVVMVRNAAAAKAPRVEAAGRHLDGADRTQLRPGRRGLRPGVSPAARPHHPRHTD
jgi:simple sugar transport system permease protein